MDSCPYPMTLSSILSLTASSLLLRQLLLRLLLLLTTSSQIMSERHLRPTASRLHDHCHHNLNIKSNITELCISTSDVTVVCRPPRPSYASINLWEPKTYFWTTILNVWICCTRMCSILWHWRSTKKTNMRPGDIIRVRISRFWFWRLCMSYFKTHTIHT